eukprot:gene965-biopygen216
MDNKTKLESLEKKIQGKTRLLEFISEETNEILLRKEKESIERQLGIYERRITEIHELKCDVQELKLEDGEEPGELRSWSNKICDNIKEFEPIIAELRAVLTEIKQLDRSEEEKSLLLAKQKLFEQEAQFEQAKFEEKIKRERKLEEIMHGPKSSTNPAGGEASTKVKLPKLIISKFQGTHIDWFRFWNQFEAEIDKANIDSVAKFSYLKELLLPKVRVHVEGLPFTTEGYERAKHILRSAYGKSSEVINAYVQNLTSLPVIKGNSPSKVHDFYAKLLTSVQALESMGKLSEVNGFSRATLDKLEGIKSDLVRTDDDWQKWAFPQLVEALRRWTERNPIPQDDKGVGPNLVEGNKFRFNKQEKMFHTKQHDFRPRPCVYCEESKHKSYECDKIQEVEKRRDILRQKRLCFNCTGANHRALECQVKSGCRNCHSRHHTSICDNRSNENKTSHPTQVMLATGTQGIIYPVVVVKVNGITCRALLDTGAGSSYISSKLIDILKIKPVAREHRKIDMMMASANRKIDIYNVEVKSLKEDFKLGVSVSKVERESLLSITNPEYKKLLRRYQHLNGVEMDDTDDKAELPIHLIIGASEYAKIKTDTKPKLGKPGEPVGEMTKLGWTIISPGSEVDTEHLFFAKTSGTDYEKLCSLDILGLGDREVGNQSVFGEFAEQLEQRPEGFFETGLLWKANCPPLPDNKGGSLARLEKLIKRLERDPDLYMKYDQIIQDQKEKGIVEVADKESTGKVFYLPHKEVIRETAETTKLRIVFDASAKTNTNVASLNDCLETGPPTQNLIWDILVRNRSRPITLAGDLKQAFLQIRVREAERDVLRFHWVTDMDRNKKETLRFTRVLFGLSQSPFLLGGTIEQLLRSKESEYPAEVEEIRQSIYVDDLLLSANKSSELKVLKAAAVKIFSSALFELHKWHSNDRTLESVQEETEQCKLSEQTYAKQQVGTTNDETKLLGLPWDKTDDTLAISFPKMPELVTKRTVLRGLASVYDPLGIVSPVLLTGKILYRDICDEGLTWDEEITGTLLQRWQRFVKSLPERIEIPRSVTPIKEEVTSIDLHAFGDASGQGVSAAVYAVVNQESSVNQGLLVSKSRLAKKGLTIPRLELIAGQMATSLIDNVKQALKGQPVKSCTSWLDSSVALHWVRGLGNYKQFVHNRVKQIQSKDYITWRHVPTNDNPADIGSRGCLASRIEPRWFQGPPWLINKQDWPADIVTAPSEETERELQPIKEILKVAIPVESVLDKVLEKFEYWKAMRVTAWIFRFIWNLKAKKSQRIKDPLSTKEIQNQITQWIRRVQSRATASESFKADEQRLNIQRNNEDILECRGRIQGQFPIYLPTNALFTEKLVMNNHVSTGHGGVSLTMSSIRERFWVPRLRQLVKKLRLKCAGCKRFHAKAFGCPPPGILPKDRTEGSRPFEVIGVDYAGPFRYKCKGQIERKAYILLFACSLTRAVYIETVTDMTVEQFIPCLKGLIARRGRPSNIYSDNAKTFISGAEKLKVILKSEKFNNYLARNDIRWTFNLSKAPWWGGQYERIIGLVKQSLYKVVGNANLKLPELKEVMLDVETSLNNRPLCYVEDDIQMPELTPNVMMLGSNNVLLQEDIHSIKQGELRKRAKYLERCKENVWRRWSNEYVKALREKHNLMHHSKDNQISVGDVVLIKGEAKNRGQWRIGVVESLIQGKDGIVRAARLRSKNARIERAVQMLYSLELNCDMDSQGTKVKGNEGARLRAEAKEFRPKRKAATIAEETIKETLRDEERELADD